MPCAQRGQTRRRAQPTLRSTHMSTNRHGRRRQTTEQKLPRAHRHKSKLCAAQHDQLARPQTAKQRCPADSPMRQANQPLLQSRCGQARAKVWRSSRFRCRNLRRCSRLEVVRTVLSDANFCYRQLKSVSRSPKSNGPAQVKITCSAPACLYASKISGVTSFG